MRHAEPAITGVLLGQADPALGRKGQAQARNLHLPDAAIFSSTLRRATQTAEIAGRGKPFRALAFFDEISYGAWDGLRWEEIERRDPDLAHRKLEDWLGVTPPGGEPWSEFRKRIARGLEELPSSGATVLISHQAVHAAVAELLTGADPVGFRQEYGEMRILEW